MFAGYSIVHWLVALVIALLVALLVYYGLAFLFGLVGIAIPHVILVLLAILVFLGVLFGGPRYWGSRRA